jgi:hypothetical protein
MLKGLDAPKDALVIMDAAIATEANLGWLRDQDTATCRWLPKPAHIRRHWIPRATGRQLPDGGGV